MQNMRMILVGAVFLAAGIGAVVLADRRGWLEPAQEPTSKPCKHQQPEGRCPWCDKSLVTKEGECKEHGGPKALCWLCNPKLIAGYSAENDWCAPHKLPESRCVT